MNRSFNMRMSMLAGLELLLASGVLLCAFALVFAREVPSASQVHGAVMAPVIFAMSFLLPMSVLGVHRFRRVETPSRFLLEFACSIGAGLFLCYIMFDQLPPLAHYRHIIPDAAALGGLGLLLLRLVVVPRLSIPSLQQRVLILGTAADAAMVAHALGTLAERGVHVVGFYQTDPSSPVGVPADRVVSR